MTIPIYKVGDEIPPDQKFYYLVGKDGFYLHKTTAFYSTTVQVKEIPGLGVVKECLSLVPEFVPIPWKIIKQALDFFRAVYAKHKAEGIVLLGFNKETKQWYLIPVEQEVSGAHLDYKVNGTKGAVGTIHSHPTFGAFYSGTDNHDDQAFDGIHIVLGQITEETPKIEVSAMVNGNRFEFKPPQVISGIPKPIEADITHDWVDKFVKKKSYQTSRAGYYPNRGGSRYGGWDKKDDDKDKKDTKKESDGQLVLLDDDTVNKVIDRHKKKGEDSAPFAKCGTTGTCKDSAASDK